MLPESGALYHLDSLSEYYISAHSTLPDRDQSMAARPSLASARHRARTERNQPATRCGRDEAESTTKTGLL